MIPIFKPSYNDREAIAVAGVLASGWSGMGPRVEEFEAKFAEYIGTKYAVALNSGTAALHLAVKCLVPPGLTIITTPITFVSTAHAILYNDCKPVFVDVEPDTLNIDPTSISEELLEEAMAIIVVHYAGHACDMDRINTLAEAYDLTVIEDAAHGCGGKFKDRMLGNVGDVGCFSFHAVKNLSCGDGGMITTNNEGLAEYVRRMRWVGIDKSTWGRSEKAGQYAWDYNVSSLGFKCHMNDITAAIGLVQLEKLDEANSLRSRLAQRYTDAFYSGHAAVADVVETPTVKPYATSAWHAYVIKTQLRAELHSFLAERGISSGVHYKPLNLHSFYYLGHGREAPESFDLWRRLLTLPLYPDMTDQEQDRVIEAVTDFFWKGQG
jgi:perosamine synthetase